MALLNIGGKILHQSKRLWPLSALLCLSVFACPCTASAQTYQITEQELTRLEYNLTQLSKINNVNLNELSELNNTLKTQKFELAELKRENEAQLQSLMKANEYLAQYEKEVRRHEIRLKRQRTLAYFIAGGLFVALVKAV